MTKRSFYEVLCGLWALLSRLWCQHIWLSVFDPAGYTMVSKWCTKCGKTVKWDF